TTDTWGSTSLKVLRDADGAALIAKPETEYTITVTYRLGKYPEGYTATWEDHQNGGEKAKLYMYVMVGFNPSIRNAFQNNNGQTGAYGKAVPQEHMTWFDHGYGLGLWTDVCGEIWATETFKITTKSLEQYVTDGYIPAFTLSTGVANNNYEVHIKDVTISEHVHDFVANPDKDTVADCTNPGKFAYECACGEVKYEIDPEAPALGHGATKEVVTLEPQIGVAGSKDIVCLVCGKVIETVEIPALEDPGTSDEPTYIVGDVDGNGDVDAADLAILKKVIAKLTPIDDPIVVNTDVDGNGEEIPDAADLAKLKKIIAKLD
ncbi:MAG: dockerin type I repeat-containing protein, partial [Oscillospiraceae bacterium]|nr:dockerin type I repeat-containing protein [Oscillospiraceae bacterium]